jgi:hypothetical protein
LPNAASGFKADVGPAPVTHANGHTPTAIPKAVLERLFQIAKVDLKAA